MSNRKDLENHILSLSFSKCFDVARFEWRVVDYYISEGDNCPCGQEIKELCYITNVVTGKTTYVGNVCINNFLGLETESVFSSLRKLRENPNKAKPSLALIEHAWKKGFLYNKEEKDFLTRMSKKRKFTPKQREWLNKVNWRILNKVVRRNVL